MTAFADFRGKDAAKPSWGTIERSFEGMIYETEPPRMLCDVQTVLCQFRRFKR